MQSYMSELVYFILVDLRKRAFIFGGCSLFFPSCRSEFCGGLFVLDINLLRVGDVDGLGVVGDGFVRCVMVFSIVGGGYGFSLFPLFLYLGDEASSVIVFGFCS
ncbi:unnamed protein product [Trifolium pratense]|uniref:Uncharacterized protein n=1 Tax=Trifolium pratense TaxID=57577 RepID=A0ACB0KBF8_TRIPR|nr:unnamed protein product [Trifolium pratense]